MLLGGGQRLAAPRLYLAVVATADQPTDAGRGDPAVLALHEQVPDGTVDHRAVVVEQRLRDEVVLVNVRDRLFIERPVCAPHGLRLAVQLDEQLAGPRAERSCSLA